MSCVFYGWVSVNGVDKIRGSHVSSATTKAGGIHDKQGRRPNAGVIAGVSASLNHEARAGFRSQSRVRDVVGTFSLLLSCIRCARIVWQTDIGASAHANKRLLLVV